MSRIQPKSITFRTEILRKPINKNRTIRNQLKQPNETNQVNQPTEPAIWTNQMNQPNGSTKWTDQKNHLNKPYGPTTWTNPTKRNDPVNPLNQPTKWSKQSAKRAHQMKQPTKPWTYQMKMKQPDLRNTFEETHSKFSVALGHERSLVYIYIYIIFFPPKLITVK